MIICIVAGVGEGKSATCSRNLCLNRDKISFINFSVKHLPNTIRLMKEDIVMSEYDDEKKKEMQKSLDSILTSGKSKLEMTNEIQKLSNSDFGTFATVNLDLMEELLSDYMLSNQWDRERTGCWYDESCERGSKRECCDCPKMEKKMKEGYKALAKDNLGFANQAIEVYDSEKDNGS